MDQKIRNAIYSAVENEPFANAMKIKLVDLELGSSAVEMMYDPEQMNNIYDRAHGGALFALIDEAFETAGQTDGTIAVALAAVGENSVLKPPGSTSPTWTPKGLRS